MCNRVERVVGRGKIRKWGNCDGCLVQVNDELKFHIPPQAGTMSRIVVYDYGIFEIQWR
jgi:hypothetical protein